MVSTFKRVAAAGAVAALGLSLAACGGSDDGDNKGSGNNGSGSNEAGTKGGTLTVLSAQPYEAADPARIYYGVQIAHYRRTLYRGLVGLPITDDPDKGNTPVADLATDTGTATDGGATWAFTLKDGVKWEDGSDITCEDVKYGTSRPFANDVIINGPNYMLAYLDIPKDAKDESMYKGPYTGEGQELFDKAVTCEGKTITFHFNKPWADFPEAIASLMMADPYKKEFDEQGKSKWKVLSNGPYKVEGGNWSKNDGAKLVRNENYDPATDDPETLRRALPDVIDYKVDPSDTAVELNNERLLADAGPDQTAITTSRVQPSQFAKLGSVKDRHVNIESPYNSYLVPNFNRPVMQNPAVRQALSVATNLDGYVKALGGDLAAKPGETIVNPGVPGSEPNPAFDTSNAGDADAAKKILTDAGVAMPVKIKVGYTKTPTADKAFAVLKETWDKAGFDTTLSPLTDTYYDIISTPDDDYDVTWAGWGADWPSMSTVLPPLFDNRPNFSKTTCGNDYGCYKSADFNALVDKAAAASSVDDQIAALQEADVQLGKDFAYIPLEVTKFNWLFGSKVTGFMTTPASNGYPELGSIGVKN